MPKNAAAGTNPTKGLAPAVTTVINELTINACPILGTIVIVGAYKAPVTPAKPAPIANVTVYTFCTLTPIEEDILGFSIVALASVPKLVFIKR